MTSDEQPQPIACGLRPGGPQPLDYLEQSVDPAIAGDHDLARHPLTAQIGRAGCGRRQEQAGQTVDGDSILFLGPRHRGVERAQACLDMRDRHPGGKTGQGPAQRARCVALDHQQGRWIGQRCSHGPGHRIRMHHRIGFAGASKADSIIIGKAVVGGRERVLVGE